MRVAIVYDRVNKFGGAERFLVNLLKVFPAAPIFTLVHSPKDSSWARKTKVIPTFLNKVAFFRSRHEILAPIFPLAIETHNFDNFDVIFSVTSSDAKAIITKPNQLHICICLTPNRYLWSGYEEYKSDAKIRVLPQFVFDYFRKVDQLTAQRPDHFIAISKAVQKRIGDYYHRDSAVIFPPVDDIFFDKSLVPANKRSYFLVVSRLVPYKKVDLVVKTFASLNLPLLVVGTGSAFLSIKKNAGPKTFFLGDVSDKRLIELYRYAKAVIFPQVEDFGLVALESQACGTPVIAYSAGGALETVIRKKTGLFFDQQDENSLAECVKNFLKLTISPSDCRVNAKRFSTRKFKKAINSFLLSKL